MSLSSRLLFFITLMLGTFIAVSSSSWFSAWMGLELNLLSFIPIISSSSNIYSSEASLKYFLIQALASAILLIGAPALILFKVLPNVFILMSLLMKMGAAPVHFWFPTVMQGIKWNYCLILMTIQKIAPMLLVSSLIYSNWTFYMICLSSILSSLIGALSGLNQTLLRKIMAYSSINHMAWMLAAIPFNMNIWFNYFIIYSLMSASVVALLYFLQAYHFNQMSMFSTSLTFMKVLVSFSLLSLGGLPPFLGFIPKMMIIQLLSAQNMFLWMLILLFSALLTLFYYLRMILMSFTLSSPKIKILIKKNNYLLLYSFSYLNLSPLIIPFLTFIPF
uniref:NADH dehydrogenase subunit 2 n=1 Tax=Glyphocrangon regalis TaxID=1616678 RepID=UPI0023D88FB9|nr:NADH dehydrogenase subunit 2 [Glyphocrangon regalis]WDD39101.1 NADH dehydrogenase subunit 2 [Glyphocrangon regalis]